MFTSYGHGRKCLVTATAAAVTITTVSAANVAITAFAAGGALDVYIGWRDVNQF